MATEGSFGDGSDEFDALDDATPTVSYRQDPNSASARVNHYQGSRSQIGLMLVEGGDD